MLKLFLAVMFFRAPRTVESADRCRVSPLPNGWIENATHPFAKLAVGDYVNSYTIVTYKCNNKYQLEGSALNLCSSGEWLNAAPKCICYSIDTRRFDKTCIDDGIGTLTREDSGIKCGKVTQNVTKTPWDARIVIQNAEQFFGTIINARFVISNANYLIDRTVNELYDLSKIRVEIVRQYFIQQKLNVERVAFPPYFGKHMETPRTNNIAVLGLQTSIQFTSYVVPICLPFGLSRDSLTRIKFTGRTPKHDDIEIQFPRNCYPEFKSTAKPRISTELLCTNHLKMTSNDIPVGSSFAISVQKDGSEEYHLIGVRTLNTPYHGGIYFQFQNVLFHENFIQNEIQGKSTPVPVEECLTPCGIVRQNERNTPWDVHISNQAINQYVLGTIISARLVLTIAEPFSEVHDDNDLFDLYMDIVFDNVIQQEIEVEKIAYALNPIEFPNTSPSDNIVMVRLRNSIIFKLHVSPICISFERSAANAIGNTLKGRTPQQNNIELHPPAYCSSKLHGSYQGANVFCTSHTDITPGSSFAVPITKRGSEAFYLVSLCTWRNTEDKETLFAFQNVMLFQEFIQREISDDREKRCKVPGETPSGSCRADRFPYNGDALYEKNNQTIKYGEIIENSVQIIYRCIPDYKLYGNETNICLNGEWQLSTPKCKPRCSPNKIQGVTIKASCTFQEGNVTRMTSCSQPAPPGTVAVLSCQSGYERFSANQQTSTCGTDGRWSPLPDKCTPVCGEINEAVPLIVGGEVSEIGKAPWHAGIYSNNNETEEQQICGGSIITSKIILSAMHCFWDSSQNEVRPLDEFRVAVGKSKRKYSAPETLKPQFFEVEKIEHEPGYSDFEGRYATDIAVVILNKFIEFKPYIAPVCIDLHLMNEDKVVQPGLLGRVAGWGLEQTSGKPSSLLKEIELPVVSRPECIEQSTMEFRQFITNDKFCAGHLTGVGVCQGDSGGGLVIKKDDRFKTMYFLRGIVSAGENFQGSCDNSKYTTFTNIAYFSDLIQEHKLKHQPNL